MLKHLFFILLLVSGLIQADAQSGWDFLYGNDLFTARTVFEEDLKKDSLNESSLMGIMLIAEITEDDEEWQKAARRLMFVKKDDGNFHTLFSDYASLKTKDILENRNLNITAKLPYLMEDASNEKYLRHFDKSQKIYNDNISRLNWSFLGPFMNINGYGFEIPFEPETDPYQAEKLYSYKKRDQYKWVAPKNYDPTGAINFDSYLLEDYNGSVYYANTFFELKEEKKIQIRISRTEPIKIWLNDELIFENWRQVNFEWDGDIIQVTVPAGYNRLMIKYCPGYYYSGKEGGEYGGYGDYDEYADDYGNYSLFNDHSSMGLIVRITDNDGNLVPVNSSSDLQSYSKKVSVHEQTSRQTMTYFKNNFEKNERDVAALYLYYLAARHAGLTDEIEEMLFMKLQAYPANNIIRFLLASVYTENGKKEIAERILSSVNPETFPIFSVLYKNLKQIDSENEAEQYFGLCQFLHSVSPSNLSIIKRILDYYEEKGMNDEKKNLAKDLIKKYPDYEYTLEEYTKDNNKPNDYDIGNDYDYSSSKEEKRAAKSIKKYYSTYNYETLISKYKGENKTEKVLALYDEVIRIEPDHNYMRQQKAEYLFNIDRNQEAIAELQAILLNCPYDENIYELLGDIYFDMKDNDNALKNYEMAKKYGNSTSYEYSWLYGGGESVEDKISRIAGQKQLKNKFVSKSFEEMAADDSWKEKYGSDESVILGYTSDIYYEADGNIHMYTRMMIKILTEAGANSWTEYNFGFLGDLTLVKVIKKNGAEVVPDHSGTFVVFKNLEPGDVIKLEGNAKTTDDNELGNFFGMFNVLSLHAPMHYAKVEMAVPENSHLSYLGQKVDYQNVQKTAREGMNFYKWEFNSIDKIVNEEAIIDIYDLYPILQLNSFKDWSPIVEWYMAKTYRKLEPNYETRNIIDSLIKPGMTDHQKVETIYNYITKDINYSFTQLLQSNYIPKNSDLTICSKIGDCKDVSTLLITLLRMVDIKAYYVLVKTNSYFHMQTLPNLYFDHVITAYEIDGKMYFTDPTSDYYPYTVTNENDVDAWGLLIREGEKEIFRLPNDEVNPEKNLVTYTIDATLNTDRSLQMNIDGEFKGLAGGYMREMYQRTAKDNFETELLKFMGKGVFENPDMEKFILNNPAEITPPLTGNFQMSASGFSDNIDEIQFMRIPYMNAVRPSPIISARKRYNSLDLSEIIDPEPTLQKVTIHLPAGYSLRKMPKDIIMENEFVTYKVTFRQEKNNLYVEKFQSFKKTIVPVEEFEKFKQVYLQLLEYDRTKITFNVKK